MNFPSLIIRRFADAEAVSHAAAEEFVRRARTATAVRERFTVALAGGSTPQRMYQLLARPPLHSQVDWTNVIFFWGDERTVPPDHPDSNYRMVHETLLRTLSVPASHVHRMPVERADRDAAARAYHNEIAAVFGVSALGEPPVFDLVLLGLGTDGHTASLFPHTQALHERKRWVVANFVPRLGGDRLTLTPVILNRAVCVLFLVTGADKAGAVAEVLEGPHDPYRLPAQLVRPSAGQLLWFLDDAAASQLARSVNTKGAIL